MGRDSAPDPRAPQNPFAALREKLRGSLPPGPEPAHDGAPARGRAPVHERVTVRRERAGRGGKTVTLAEGPGLAGRRLDALANEAARALGVGARVEQGALVLQGDQGERLVAWLGSRGFGSVTRGN